jgi:hypothetical protein
MTGNRRAFATRSYPLFGRGPYNDENPPPKVTHSPFFWWFKFLQLNEEYARALKGEQTSIPSKLVADFGEVRGVSFKEWWKTKAVLFAEPTTDYKMVVANSKEELAPFNSKEAINLVIPLNWTNVGSKRRFAEIIDKLIPKTSRGVRVKTSEAEYKLGRKWRSDAFKHAYDVFLAKQESDARVTEGGKKTTWADIAINVKLPSAKEADRKPSKFNIDPRRILTVIAKRHYKRAEEFIAAAVTAKFPS